MKFVGCSGSLLVTDLIQLSNSARLQYPVHAVVPAVYKCRGIAYLYCSKIWCLRHTRTQEKVDDSSKDRNTSMLRIVPHLQRSSNKQSN